MHVERKGTFSPWLVTLHLGHQFCSLVLGSIWRKGSPSHGSCTTLWHSLLQSIVMAVSLHESSWISS